MSIYGAIDIGTNSTRLLIAKVLQHKVDQVLESKLITTRIGEGITQDSNLKPEAMTRTIEALQEYALLLKKHKLTGSRVVATSAVRDAANRNLFIELALKQTGLNIDVVSGSEEALLSYTGVVGELNASNLERVVLDVGGGSTESIWTGQNGQLRCESVPVGALRMTEGKFSLQQIEEMLKTQFRKIQLANFELVGVGGTITSLAAIKLGLEKYDPQKVHGFKLDLQDIRDILSLLESKSLAERKKIPGLQPERADIIITGTRIYEIILRTLKMDKITVSETDILYGIIFEMVKNYSLTKRD